MANEEHLAILRQGVEVWNAWRRAKVDVRPELTGADLTGMTLIGADLIEADLQRANLSRANFSGAVFSAAGLIEANLSEAILSGASFLEANLQGANLSGAEIIVANFSGANLSGADLTETDLNGTNLQRANLNGANLSAATIGTTIFADTNLSNIKGLEAITHEFPSSIGVDTLVNSCGKIPEAFLRGCGVPDAWIEYLPSLIGAMEPIQFYSCFISYSTKDEDFAKRLHERMRAEHLRVWFAPEDIKGGQKIHEQIERAIQMYDRLLLMLSDHSIQSEWVATELYNARQTELRENRRKLFPIRLTDMNTLKAWKCFDADSGKDLAREVREYHIPDFTNWKDHDSFERAFARLLKDLQATEAPPIPRQSAPVQPAPPTTNNADDPLSPQAQRQHLREVIGKKTRRLRYLEQREAVQGIATGPEDRIEIEDLRQEIAELEDKLRQMG